MHISNPSMITKDIEAIKRIQRVYRERSDDRRRDAELSEDGTAVTMRELRCSGMTAQMPDLPQERPWISVNKNYTQINAKAALER